MTKAEQVLDTCYVIADALSARLSRSRSIMKEIGDSLADSNVQLGESTRNSTKTDSSVNNESYVKACDKRMTEKDDRKESRERNAKKFHFESKRSISNYVDRSLVARSELRNLKIVTFRSIRAYHVM